MSTYNIYVYVYICSWTIRTRVLAARWELTIAEEESQLDGTGVPLSPRAKRDYPLSLFASRLWGAPRLPPKGGVGERGGWEKSRKLKRGRERRNKCTERTGENGSGTKFAKKNRIGIL